MSVMFIILELICQHLGFFECGHLATNSRTKLLHSVVLVHDILPKEASVEEVLVVDPQCSVEGI